MKLSLALFATAAAVAVSPISLVSSKCDKGCDGTNGCGLFNGCGNAGYCGGRGSSPRDHDANGIISGRGTTYIIAGCSSGKTYEDVFDFGQVYVATAFNLKGSSAGHWCEDGYCNGRAHNDNNFAAEFSSDGKKWFTPQGVKYTEAFNNLGDGGGFTMNPIRMRYVKLRVTSGCWGCSNTDTVTKMIVDGTPLPKKDLARSFFSPVSVVSSKCDMGCDGTNGCALFNGCGNAGYCGGRGSAADDHDANGIINGKGAKYIIAGCSSGKKYTDVFDFGKTITGTSYSLVGISAGHWCEDGKCPNGRAHNDNNFHVPSFSKDGVTWTPPKNVVYTEHFNNLGDGAGMVMDPIDFRYVKMVVSSGCWGCSNTDTVKAMIVGGSVKTNFGKPHVHGFRPVALTSSKCDAGCDATNGCKLFNGCGNANYCGRKGSAADDHDAKGIVSGLGATYTIARCSSGKTYTDVFDFGKVIAATALNLVGSSAGHWCEDGKCPNGRAHNDNSFSATFSVDGTNFYSPQTSTFTEHFNNLGDGAGFTMSPTKARYVKLTVRSGCWGCSNTDTVTDLLLDGVVDGQVAAAQVLSSPVKVVSSKCDKGCDAFNGCPLFNGCGNARYCGGQGSAADDHDANGAINGKGATYTIAACSNSKTYTDVFDFGSLKVGTSLNLVGVSNGHWCEDGVCPNGRAHNDNQFSVQFSTDGATWASPKNQKFTESFANLGDGAGFTFDAMDVRYMKLTVRSGCWGCSNTDTVKKIVLGGPSRTAAPTAFPTANPTAFPTANPTANPTSFPTTSPTKFPTPAPTGILSHGVCKTTTCTYTMVNGVAKTVVSYFRSANEKWHCEKVGNSCKCVCHQSLKCAIRHHHQSGYKKTLKHC